jgi:hypothetical protein
MASSITKVRRTKLKDNTATEQAERIAADQAVASQRAEATARAAAAAQAAARAAEQLNQREAEIERVLARLPADMEPAAVDQVRQQAADAAVAAGDDHVYAGAVRRLRMAVQSAQDADRSRRDTVARIERLRVELDGLDTPAVTAAQARLDGVDPRSPLPHDLPAEIRRVAEEARAERDRGYVVDALADTLDELGYDTGPEFVTGLAEDGSVVQLPWSGEHALRVRERQGRFFFNVVRYDGLGATADTVADRNAEQRFCDSYGELVDMARRRGFALDMEPPMAAGTRPLQHVPVPVGADRDRASRASHDRARERGRPS